MPKRTNDFQRLVYLVRLNLAGDAAVTESKMLVDRITGRKREVDVCIEGMVGSHPVVVSVECRDHKRIADVSWVDTMKAKHERLPTNALILASRSGFTPEARDVAAGFGIKTFSLADVEETDFPKLLGLKSSLWAKTVTVSAAKVLVRVASTADLPAETVVTMPENLVHTSDGGELFQVGKLVETLLNSRRARESLLSEGKEEHIWFDIVWEPPRGQLNNSLFMKKIEPELLREIESIQIQGPCKFEITQFGLRHGTLGDVHVAWGKTELLGNEALVVATKDTDGIEKLSIKVAGTFIDGHASS